MENAWGKSMLALAVFWAVLAPGAAAQDQYPHPRMISVTGTAEMKVAPDEVQLTLGVDTRDRDLTAAKNENDRRVRKVLALARGAGVETKDMQTSALTMDAVYSDEKVPRFLGYSVSQTVTIKLRDIAKYEGMTSDLLKAGVNRVDGIEFLASNAKKLRADARLEAVRQARQKAAAMAGELGEKIGRPWEITEEAEGLALANITGGLDKMSRYRGAEGPAVAGGEITIRASVEVSFQLD